MPFVAPPRWRSYDAWGAWAAPSLALALRRLRREWRFDLVHAHNAVPAGDAVRRARLDTPLIVSVHGGDVLWTAPRFGDRAVRRTFEAADLVMANSTRIEQRARELGARADPHRAPRHRRAARRSLRGATDDRHRRPPDRAQRHEDVLRALPPRATRYLVIGDGPERPRLERLAAQARADRRLRRPARARRGDAAGAALRRVRDAVDARGLRSRLRRGDGRGDAGDRPPRRARPGGDRRARRRHAAKPTGTTSASGSPRRSTGASSWRAQARVLAQRHFTWEACGRATVDAYASVL